jgi:hypothetical protein
MAPIQQSEGIHALAATATQTDQNKPEVALEVAGLLGNPDDALFDDLILVAKASAHP